MSVYIKQNTHKHSKLYSIEKSVKVIYINCTNGEEQKKSYVKNNVEVNWNTDYKSETYKTYTIKMIAKDERVSYARFEYVAFVIIR